MKTYKIVGVDPESAWHDDKRFSSEPSIVGGLFFHEGPLQASSSPDQGVSSYVVLDHVGIVCECGHRYSEVFCGGALVEEVSLPLDVG